VTTLEFVLGDPDRRVGIVADEPGADLDAAAAEAIAHLQAARVALAPFFWEQFAVGDVVDVVTVSEAGEERIELAGVTVVEIRGRTPAHDAVVQDAHGVAHPVSGSEIRRR
jgi:hypothetical protein